MATYSSSSSACLDYLEQARRDFWSSNARLSEEERQQQWLNTLANNAFGSTQQVPRSMPVCSTDMTQLLSSSIEYMDRTRSAPAMGSSTSPAALDDNSLQRSATAFPGWQSMSQDPANAYDVYSDASMRDSSAYQNVAEYNVADFVNCMEQSRLSPSLPLSQNSQQLHMQLTPTEMQWSTSSDGSTSPSTPSTALMTPITHSNAMSRGSSYNPNFLNTPMLRVQSDSSCMLPILAEDGAFPVSYVSKPISSDVDGSPFFSFTGSANDNFISPASQFFSASTYALASSSVEQPGLAEDMRRSASTSSSESNVSDASAPSSTSSRHLQRNREINAQAASRKIAPKAMESSHQTDSALSNAQMAKIRSEDGSSKTVGVISKTKPLYVRPQHPKIMCKYCNERPNGFRGTHELDRHIARAHSSRRKGYICVDYWPDKKFLANCKHCRNKKVYGAYYNAAAHLRRAHFHPRKRGRKGKNDEKRGGIGGGDHPAMDWLKQYWIQEIEVDNKPVPQSPDSASDDAAESADNTYNAAFDMDASYSPTHQQLPASMGAVDSSQYMSYGLNVNASEPMVMYDNTTAFAGYHANIAVTNDIQDFQFDADVYAAN